MDPKVLQLLIPIISVLAVFGFPVCLVYVWKFFKLKEHELQVDAELRRTSGQALEQRVQRLESIILALDSDLRSKLSAMPPPRELMQAPPDAQGEQPGPVMEPPAKVR